MVQEKGYLRTPLYNEKGMVLVVGLLLVAVLMILGTTAVLMSTTDIKISSNYKSGSQAFYIAEAGLERARGQLKTDLSGSDTSTLVQTALSQKLAASAGTNSVLSNSNDSANFYTGGTFLTDDVPYITTTSFGGGTYRVYLTNDVLNTGGVTSTTDTNQRVTLTSFGFGPNNSRAVVQQVVEKIVLPPLPGAIVLPGPNVIFDGANSNASGVSGGTKSAISLTSTTAETAVQTNLAGPPDRTSNYTCTTPPCINNDSATIDPTWTSVAGIEGLYNTLASMSGTITLGSPGTTTTLTAEQVGTTTDRKIVVVNGNAILGPVNGAGILVVTGQLTLSGDFNYHGLVMCIGQGSLFRTGGGSGEIDGSVFVAKTRDASNNLLATLGTSSFNTNGGGNSDIVYDSDELKMPADASFVKKSWRQFL